MVYTELQPRELEKSSRLPEDIPMPEIIGEKGFPNCDIPDGMVNLLLVKKELYQDCKKNLTKLIS